MNKIIICISCVLCAIIPNAIIISIAKHKYNLDVTYLDIVQIQLLLTIVNYFIFYSSKGDKK